MLPDETTTFAGAAKISKPSFRLSMVAARLFNKVDRSVMLSVYVLDALSAILPRALVVLKVILLEFTVPTTVFDVLSVKDALAIKSLQLVTVLVADGVILMEES